MVKAIGCPIETCEDMTCVGCAVVDGPHVGYCAACEIRTCGVQKKVQNCAYCIEYKCDKLKLFHDRSPRASPVGRDTETD